jgi:amino acid adenylation domain-containing protein
MAQLSNMSFDGSTFEIWGALLHGLTLALAPKRVVLRASDLVEFFTQAGVTVCVMTPTLLHIVLESDERVLSGMREIWIGGEVLEPSVVRRLRRLYPTLRIVNGYGPTESTAFATVKRVETCATDTRIPIGRVISNTEVYVLDEEFLPVPCGFEGEIFIAGDGLARGYLGEPALTAERFVPNPFATGSAVGENRMYRTGDRACVLPNGDIDFLGRLDGQVKIRGQRIELGEIEAACAKHPSVNRVLARARRNAKTGDLRIIAYI